MKKTIGVDKDSYRVKKSLLIILKGTVYPNIISSEIVIKLYIKKVRMVNIYMYKWFNNPFFRLTYLSISVIKYTNKWGC